MHFPRYWTTARKNYVSAWGWSDTSLSEAEGKAAERLSKILDRLARGDTTPVQRYGYPNRPVREEVLREFRAENGTLRAAVTRNSYGCLVLNTANLMFVDVDAREPKDPGFFARLFGSPGGKVAKRAGDFDTELVGRVHDWVTKRPGWGWRVYRTRAGIRLLATQQVVAPDDAVSREVFEAFEADPLYRQLCLNQKSFRARLTPKPWRCDVEKPRGRWPWANEKTEAAFRKWETRYLAAAEKYATCSLMGEFGKPGIAPELADLVEFHDKATRVESGLPLA